MWNYEKRLEYPIKIKQYMEYKYLIGLDSKSYEHELDRKFLNLLKGKTGFEAATNASYQV